jgi:hypothetical protein
MKDRAMAARERPLDFSDRRAGLQARALQAAGERKVGAASSPKKVGVLGVTENSRVLILSQGSNLWSNCGMPGLRTPRGRLRVVPLPSQTVHLVHLLSATLGMEVPWELYLVMNVKRDGKIQRNQKCGICHRGQDKDKDGTSAPVAY